MSRIDLALLPTWDWGPSGQGGYYKFSCGIVMSVSGPDMNEITYTIEASQQKERDKGGGPSCEGVDEMKWGRGSRFCSCTEWPQLTVATLRTVAPPSRSRQAEVLAFLPPASPKHATPRTWRSRDSCIGHWNLPRQTSTSPIVALCPAFCIARDSHYSLLFYDQG